MSQYKIGDIVLCKKYNNIMKNYFTGEIVHIIKLRRYPGKGIYAEKHIAIWCIFDFITCNKYQPEKLYRYDIKYKDGSVEQNIPAKLIKYK
jgi:hypothetical protein